MSILNSMSFKNIDLSNVYCNNNNIFNIAQGGSFNSIFNCMFGSPFGYYTPFNGNCKSAFGFQLGSVLGSIGLMAANCFINRKIEEKQANSPETFTNDLNEINTKINEQLKVLGVSSTDEAMSLKVEDKFENNIKTKEDAYNESVNGYNHERKILEGVTNNLELTLDKITEKKTILATLDSEKNKKEYEQIKLEIEALEAREEALRFQKEENEKLVKELKEKVDSDLKAYENALDAKEARENEIKTAQEALRPLIEKRDAIQAKLDAIKKAEENKNNNKTLNTADKTIFGRTSKENLIKKGVFNDDYKDAGNLDGKDIAGLINMYREGDIETKKKVQEFFKKHQIELTEDAKSGKSISKSIDIILNAKLD